MACLTDSQPPEEEAGPPLWLVGILVCLHHDSRDREGLMSFCKEAPSAIGRPLAYGKTDRLWPHFKVMGAAMITPGVVAIGDKHGSKQEPVQVEGEAPAVRQTGATARLGLGGIWCFLPRSQVSLV